MRSDSMDSTLKTPESSSPGRFDFEASLRGFFEFEDMEEEEAAEA